MPSYNLRPSGEQELATGTVRGVQFAYKPNQIIASEEAFTRIRVLLEPEQWDVLDRDRGGNVLVGLKEVDVLRLAETLTDEGLVAEPNYALFAQAFAHHGRPQPNAGSAAAVGAAGAAPEAGQAAPFWANAGQASPFWANPFWANPFWANPFWANAGQANPFWATGGCPPPCPEPVPVAWVCPPPQPVCCCKPCKSGTSLPPRPKFPVTLEEFIRSQQSKDTGRSSAEPAPNPGWHLAAGARHGPLVIVLDTGLAVSQHLPPLLADLDATPSGDRDSPSEDGDAYLDPFAGHGTFVAGVVEHYAPGMNLRVGRVLNTTGATFQWSLTSKLETLLAFGIAMNDGKDAMPIDERTIINFSLSGFAPYEMKFLKERIKQVQERGAVVVAAAGNDASSEKTYPAALPDVIGVGALDSNASRAWFSNYGPWVRACAPGKKVLSSFFTAFNGLELPGPNRVDPDRFEGWAYWSGTSFAAPAVAAALANEMVASDCTAREAVANVIDASGLSRVPELGTRVKL